MKDHEIFIVDDSQVQLVLLEKVLKQEGFSIRSFSRGWELIEALEQSRPSLIISDIDMPSLNGFELLQEIKGRFKNSRIPFFFISSNSDSTTEQRAQRAGAQALIGKPYSYSTLVAVIEDLLGIAKA